MKKKKNKYGQKSQHEEKYDKSLHEVRMIAHLLDPLSRSHLP